MKQYVTDKRKKLILEEYLIDSLKDYHVGNKKPYESRFIINVDITTLINGNKTFITLVYRDTIENPFSDDEATYKYASKHVPLYIEDHQLICRPTYDVDIDGTIEYINVILKSFNRVLNLNQLV